MVLVLDFSAWAAEPQEALKVSCQRRGTSVLLADGGGDAVGGSPRAGPVRKGGR